MKKTLQRVLTSLSSLLTIISRIDVQAEPYQTTESFSLESDQKDPLGSLRELFYIPSNEEGKSLIYFCGHSLGLQPKKTSEMLQNELNAWAQLGVDGHFKADSPWYSYHELVRDSLAKLVGSQPQEVVAMNSLTVNLHLMMVSFYQPSPTRYKILMETPVFSSDTYVAKSQIAFHGYDSKKGLIIIEPKQGHDYLEMEDIE